jgi:glutamate-1-semialdehyde 2,1-aminomutase
MTAVRIARAATGREKIIKFNGCYHGHADTFLVKAGSGALTLGNPSSPGVSADVAKNTLVAEFNDLESIKQIVENDKAEVAAIIIEPVAGNMGCIPPEKEFLKKLKALANENGTLLIFDEVMTGFRLAAGGAQELFGVQADLVTFGKIIGGGFPVGAVAGPDSLMNQLAPAGPVYQAGTLSGNPVATTAGITVLSELKNNPGVYTDLNRKSEVLQNGLNKVFADAEVPVQINRVGSMISVFFSEKEIQTFDDVASSDMQLFSAFFHEMLNNGVHLPPSGYEAWFLATTLNNELIEKTIEAAEKAIKTIKKT